MQSEVGFETPLPDFTDCSFASREPDADWLTIAREGGPVRAFGRMMPAFGGVLTEAELAAILDHIRTYCTNPNWPPGDFNLPLALYTEKAFPEDETVLRSIVAAEGLGSVTNELVYEKRFGPRSQIELTLPFGFAERAGRDGWTAGIGDLAAGLKHTLYFNLDAGMIFSAGGEIILPTGDEDRGFGNGTTILEPFFLYGQILSHDMFFQAHVFAEFPTKAGFDDELGWRAVFGRTWAEGGIGRSWTPMLEVLGARDLASGAETHWDLVPQLQISLSTRQHILLNFGARIPITNAGTRTTQVGIYVLWDWFDGGLLEGW